MIKKLFRHVEGARKLFAASILFGALGGCLLIVQAVCLARIVDDAFLGELGLSSLWPALLVLLGIIAARSGLQAAGDYASTRMAQSIKSDLRLRLIRKLAELGPQYGKGERSGELIGTVYEGVEQLENYLAKYLPQIALSAFIPAAVFCLVAGLDWISAIVFAVTMPLLVLLMILIGKAAKARTDRQFHLLGRLGGHFHEMLRGLPTLKMFNRSRAQIAVIASISEEHRRSTMSTLRLAFLSAMVMELFAALSTAIVAVFLGLRLVDGEIGFEAAFLVLLLAPEFYTPIRTLGTQFHAGMNGVTAAERIFEILNAEPAGWAEREDGMRLPPKRGGYAIELRDVSVRYPGAERDALSGVSLRIEPGERIAVVGPTGAGKSTLLDLLQGFVKPTAGQLYIDGIEMSQLSVAWWREQLSVLPQRVHLFHGTVRDNIRLGRPEADDAEVAAAAGAAQADAFVRSLPQGYDTVLGETARLSGGQAQRIAIARALLRDTPVLLLDEPTSGLDLANEAAVTAGTEPLLRGRTSVTVAHRLATVQAADRILVIEDGRLAESGTPQELQAAGGLYARMYRADYADRVQEQRRAEADRMPMQATAAAAVRGREQAGRESGYGAEHENGYSERRDAGDGAWRETEHGAEREAGHKAGRDGAANGKVRASSAADSSGAGAGAGRAERGTQGVEHKRQEPPAAGYGRTLLRLLQFVRPYKWRAALAVLLGIATTAANVGLMGTSGYLIAKAALRPENVLMLYVPIVGVRFFGIARGVARYTERLASHDLTFRILTRLRVWLYERLEPRGVRLLENRRSGDLLGAVMSDVEQLQNLYLRVIAPPLVAAATLLLGFVLLARVHLQLGLLLAGMMLLTGIAVPWLSHLRGRRSGAELVRERADMYTEAADLVAGLPDLLIYGRLADKEGRLRSIQHSLDSHQDTQNRIVAGTSGLMTGLAHLAMWLVLAAAIALTAAGRIEGMLIPAMALIALACFEAIMPLPASFQQFGQTMSAGQRLFQLAGESADEGAASAGAMPLPAGHARRTAGDANLAAPTASAAAQASVSPASVSPQGDPAMPASVSPQGDPAVPMPQSGWQAALSDVSFRYGPDEPYALRDLSLTLARGKRVAVVGESGAGKSTLLQLLLKLRPYEMGSIRLNGEELGGMAEEAARNQFAVVSQNVQLFNATVAENLRLGRPDATDEELRKACRMAMIEDTIRQLPDGYHTVIGEWGAKLSGGERQRLALARAILRDAPAILFDEPATGIDALTELAFTVNLEPYLADKAVLWITHKLSGLEQMDEIVVLQNGVAKERGTHDELLAQGGVYRSLWEFQGGAGVK